MVAIAATLEALLFLFIGMLCGSLVTVILLKKKKTNDNFETLGLPLTRVESQNALSQVNDSLDLTLLELEQEEAVQNPVYDQIIVSETALDAERSVNTRSLEASAECLYDFSNNTTESQPNSTNICLELVESKITETKAQNLASPVLGQRLVSPAQDTTDAPKSFKPPVLPPRTPKPDFPVSQTHIESKITETKTQNFGSPVLGQRPAQDTTDVSKSFKPPVLPPRTPKPDFPVSQTHIQISRKEVLKRKKLRKPSGAELIPEIKNGDSGTDESADANKVLSPIKLPPRNTSQPQHNISTQVNVSYKYLGPLGSEDGEKLGENQESPHCLVSSSESSHHGNSESMPINANVSYKYLGPLDNTSEDEAKSAERGSTLDCFVGSGDHGITDPGLPVHSNSESMKFNSNVAYKYLGPLDEEPDDQRIPEGHDHDVQSQNNYHLEPADSSEDREYVPKTEVAGDPPGEDQEPDENISVQLKPNVSYKYLGPLDEPQV